MPLNILGILFVVAGLLLHRGIKRARERGYTGPKHRRVHRTTDRWKFKCALGSQALGALICFIGAYLCLSHAIVHRF